MIRGADAGAATDGPASTTAAAPSVNELHMSRVRTPATWGEARTSSMVTVRWHWASGLRAAWSNALTAAAAIWRTVAPASAMSRWAQPLLRPMRMLPAGLSSAWRRSCRSWRYSAGRPSSMPAMVSARSPVHIFSTPEGQDRPVLDGGRHGRQVQRRAAAGARVVDVDDGGLAQAGLAQPGLAAHAALVAQPPGHGVADDDEPELVRRERRRRRAPRAPPGRPWSRGRGRAGSCRSCRCRGWRRRWRLMPDAPAKDRARQRRRRRRAAGRSARRRASPATITTMWRAPASA